jgi:hypothetical protein
MKLNSLFFLVYLVFFKSSGHEQTLDFTVSLLASFTKVIKVVYF